MNSNKVLMITYPYPPDGASSGMLRPLKFSRYLSEFNWQVSVLTARMNDYLLRDDTLIVQIPPNVSIYRSFAPNSKKYFYIFGKSFKFLSFPDRVLCWWPFAYIKGIEAINKDNPVLLWSTSPMVTTHLIAYSLKKKAGLPWIVDFRDPWFSVTDTGWQRKVNEILEQKVMQFADAVVVTTDWMKKEILARIPNLSSEKIYVIHNGYDEEDFADLSPTSKYPDDPFVMVYTGLLDADYRNPKTLFKAISHLRDQSFLPMQGFRIDFYGCSEYLSRSACVELIISLGLSDIVRDCGRVSRKQSLQVLIDADALLLIQDADMTRSAIPAKAFDYVRTGKPILALASDGATPDLLEKYSKVVLIRNAEKIYDVANGLRKLFLMCSEQIENNGSISTIIEFERKNLTGKLADLMNSLITK